MTETVGAIAKRYREGGGDGERERLFDIRREVAKQVMSLQPADFVKFVQAELPVVNKLINLSGIGASVTPAAYDLTLWGLELAYDADPLRRAQGIVAAGLLDHARGFPIPPWSALSPNLVTACTVALTTPPPFFREIGECRRFQSSIQAVMASLRTAVDSHQIDPFHLNAQALNHHGAGVWFHDQSTRTLREDFCHLLQAHLRSRGVTLDHHFPARPADRRPRIGILRANWRKGAETSAMKAHLVNLPQDHFDLYAVLPQDTDPDTRAYCEAAGLKLVQLPHDLVRALHTLRLLELDVLMFGTNLLAGYELPAALSVARVARHQMATTMNPTTTGSPMMDSYLTGSLNERSDAQEDYSETLIRLPGTVNRYCFASHWPQRPEPLADGQPLRLVSGANYKKITPELAGTWFEILRDIPDSILCLYPFNPNWEQPFPANAFEGHLRQLMQEHGLSIHRLEIHPPCARREDLLELIAGGDIYLDSFPYSGAVSIIDPMEIGLPVVVCRGHQGRSRQSAALFQELGLGEMVADGPDAYKALVRRLAANADLRRDFARRARAAWMALDQRLDLRDCVMELVGRGDETSTPTPTPDKAMPGFRVSGFAV